MKAFVRFSKCANGLFFAMIEPDFNVLPLIATFFKNRYADQAWLIYDIRRHYGILYDQTTMQEVELTHALAEAQSTETLSLSLDERDELFKRLWKRYFKSINITARRNLKLHVQHLPKRYWKYLVEKTEKRNALHWIIENLKLTESPRMRLSSIYSAQFATIGIYH